MSEDQQGAEGVLIPAEVGDPEVVSVNLVSKTQEFGDVSSAADSPIQVTFLDKSELDDSISMKSDRSRKGSVSPGGGKRSSKRKRKNRRRREKKAAAADETSSIPSGGEDGTGTENENSINSEETGTESENTFHSCCPEGDANSSVCVEPSTTITSIPEEDLNDTLEYAEQNEGMSGSSENRPTHSVDTLLQIAKCKIISQILGPVNQEARDSGMQEFSSSNLVVPPCSPSSLHSMNNSIDTGDRDVKQKRSGDSQKATMKNVRFEEGPTEIISVEGRASEPEQVFQLTLDDSISMREQQNELSKDTFIVVGRIGHTDSATSSVASEASAVSLLKGNGSSSEDFVESSHHYPSRETVGGSGIHAEAFRETIEIFKTQNPVETQGIENEVDAILTKSLDKFKTIMDESGNSSPLFASKLAAGREPDLDITTEGDDGEDSKVNLNTTFTVEKDTENEYDRVPSPRPVSAGEIMPKAIPDMVSDTESVSAAGHLSVVVEEDEEEDISFASNTGEVKRVPSFLPGNEMESGTVSTSSFCTVIETEAVIHKTAAKRQSTEVSDSTVAAVSGTESAAEDLSHGIGASGGESSNKSSVSSPRFPDLNENSVAATVTLDSSRPSTGTTLDSVDTEPDLDDLENKQRSTEAKKSVEVFTLHFPSTTEAPPSVNNLSGGNGDHPLMFHAGPNDTGNNNPEDRTPTPLDTETESDWLPGRKKFLVQVINERDRNEAGAPIQDYAAQVDVVAGAEAVPEQPEGDAEDENKGEQGCNCARMCVIT